MKSATIDGLEATRAEDGRLAIHFGGFGLQAYDNPTASLLSVANVQALLDGYSPRSLAVAILACATKEERQAEKLEAQASLARIKARLARETADRLATRGR